VSRISINGHDDNATDMLLL